MRIFKLTKTGLTGAVAEAHYIKKNKQLVYVVKHGSSGNNLGYWMGRISTKVTVPNNINDVIKLDRNDYILTPVRLNDKVIKDRLGNTIYNISIDRSSIYSKDILLLWDIPNEDYVNVKYEITGKCSLIGEGTHGKDRGDIIYKSPAPILEIYGDCVLKWTAKDKDNNEYGQEISYINEGEKWEIISNPSSNK